MKITIKNIVIGLAVSSVMIGSMAVSISKAHREFILPTKVDMNRSISLDFPFNPEVQDLSEDQKFKLNKISSLYRLFEKEYYENGLSIDYRKFNSAHDYNLALIYGVANAQITCHTIVNTLHDDFNASTEDINDTSFCSDYRFSFKYSLSKDSVEDTYNSSKANLLQNIKGIKSDIYLVLKNSKIYR